MSCNTKTVPFVAAVRADGERRGVEGDRVRDRAVGGACERDATAGVADDLRRVTDSEVIKYSAAGFRDFTRIAASDPTMWRDVFLNNKDATIEKSIDALEDELDRCAQLGVPFLVMHPGSHVGQGEEEGIKLIAENLEAVYAREKNDAWKDVTLLFENTAGQGTNLGHSLDHLAALFEAVHDPSRFGVCFDTCHAHAAGYDLTTKDQYEDFWREFDALIGVERVKAFHLNDSKKPLGSRKDRHENIGDGEIGRSVFEYLVNDPRFAGVPATLETPMDEENGYADEIALLKEMRDQP